MKSSWTSTDHGILLLASEGNLDIDCGPHKSGRVDCVTGLEIKEFLARNRSLLIYRASFLDMPVLAYEYAPLGLVTRLADGQLIPVSDAAQSPLLLARVAWRQGMMACDGANAASGASVPFVQPRGEGQGGAHWWIGPKGAQIWRVPMLKGDFRAQAALATQMAVALHGCRDSAVLHGNINPWAFGQNGSDSLTISASLPDERGFLPYLDDNASLWQPGFSPPEMADGARRLPLGPWTDIYGLSALMFQAITGAPPPDWTRAGDPDAWRSTLSAQLDGLCLPKVQKVIIAGLSLDYAERPQTANDWHKRMDIGGLVVAMAAAIDLSKRVADPVSAGQGASLDNLPRGNDAERDPPPKGFGWRHAALGLVLLGGAGWAASSLFSPAPRADSAQVSATEGAAEPAPEQHSPIEAAPSAEEPTTQEPPAEASDAEVVSQAARDVAEPTPQIRIVPAPAPPPPAVIISPSRPAPLATSRPVPRPTPRIAASPIGPSPVTAARSTDSEAATTRRLNEQQAAAARRQNEQNRANADAERRAKAERERKIAAEQEAYRQRLAATEAERLRRQREYQAAQARWRADVAACNAGDRSRCAQ